MIKDRKSVNSKIPDKVWTCCIFGISTVVIIQFFWVWKTYYILESGKVIRWMWIYFSIPCLTGSFFLLKTFNQHLFYNYPEYYSEKNLSKWSKFKNKLTSYGLLVALFSFFTYDTIIQTNDWLGSSERILINQSIESIHAIYHNGGSSRRGFIRRYSKGFYKSDIQIVYKGKLRKISADGDWNGRDLSNTTLNTGGFWGILYARSLL